MFRIWKDKTNLKVLIWGTIIGGINSSLVKWGSEINMPPRVPGEVSPPAAHINSWLAGTGYNSKSLDYVYQGATISGAVTLYHWIFSFVFAFVYVFASAYIPKIRAFWGAVYGIIITVFAHGLMVPLLGLRNPVYNKGHVGWLWNLNSYELWSEFIGHLYWAVSIEICLIAVLAYFAKPIRRAWA